MFGYVKINKPELKVKELECYRGYYCGLCDVLRKEYGLRGQATLTYDMTFLTILLTGLYEPENVKMKKGCLVHPVGKHLMIQNEITEYAADMNVLFSYLKFMDDWADDKKVISKTAAALLKSGFQKIRKKYPQKTGKILDSMEKLSQCEKRKESMPDVPAGCFGDVVSEIFAYRKDRWEQALRRMGYFLGKYIYLADAFSDIEDDKKEENYNVFLTEWQDSRGYFVLDESGKKTKEFEREGISILRMMMAECAREFEKLPILKNAELLRNILYAGVWTGIIKKKNSKE